MSEKHKKEIILLLTSLLIFISVVILYGGFFSQCGIGPSKKTIVELEQPPIVKPDKPVEQFCDGLPVSTVRDKVCPDNGVGKIVEVCRPDGQWYEASKDCRAACESDVPTWDSFVKDVIIDSCSECHGNYRDYNVVKNLSQIGIGGAGGVSKLIYRITLPESNDDSMPKNLPNLPLESINKIKEWVKSGSPEKSTCEVEEGEDVIDLFYIDEAINRFGNRIPTFEDRKFYRFFTFGHFFNLGQDLEPHYKALNRALNSLSFENEIQLCQPIDEKGVVCAIDIRAIGQTRDSFTVISYGDEIKFVSNTTLGKVNQDLFGVDQVFFHPENFISSSFAKANIYYHLMGFKDKDQIFGLFGINFNLALARKEYKLIGTNESAISAGRNTRLLSIFEGEINGFETQIHISFDNPASDDPKTDLFQNPFLFHSQKIFNFAASESIAGLPNGLLSFFLTNNLDQLQSFAPTDIVGCNEGKDKCLDTQIDAAIDCMSCHHDGYIPVIDSIGPHIRESRQFGADDVKLAKQVYLDQNNNAATFNEHNKRYLKALAQMNISAGEENHFIKDYIDFERAKDLEHIAAFLFIKPEVLLDCIKSSADLAEQIGSLLIGEKITKDSFIAAIPDLFEICEINIDPVIPVGG